VPDPIAASNAEGLRIAIIEDEALVAMEMEDYLTDAGFTVAWTADTAEEAISLSAENKPDLALVDIQLARGSSGIAAAAALQGLGVTCLFASGNCAGADRSHVIGCLNKPFGGAQLLQAVEAARAIMRGEKPRDLPRDLELFI
jgi:DNA-binding response OmpR family regulator